MQFREQPIQKDMEAVASILKNSGFFNEEEQEVGVSLVRERLEQGEASLYFFQFAQEGEQVLGYTCFGPIPGTKFSYDLYWIAVKNEYRGQGMGRLIMDRTEEKIKSMGGRRIYIETSSRDQYLPTQKFYETCGYKEEARLKDFYSPFDDKIIYVKAIET